MLVHNNGYHSKTAPSRTLILVHRQKLHQYYITEYNVTDIYLIMLVYRHLLTITFTWRSSCIITQATLIFKYFVVYFSGNFCIMMRGWLDNYAHMCKRLFFCVNKSCDNLSTIFL